MTQLISSLARTQLFEDRSADQIEALLAGGRERRLKHREMLFRADDLAEHFAIVVEGALKLIRPTILGNDVIMFFAAPGDVVAALIMHHAHAAYPISAVAMGPTTVITIPKSTFNTVWASDQGILQKINGVLFSRMSEMHAQKAMTKAQLPSKIARQIISLLEHFEGEGETILPIPLTRQEIADSVGASVESVIRVMSEWSQKGVIRTTDQHIEIVRMDQIVELSRI